VKKYKIFYKILILLFLLFCFSCELTDLEKTEEQLLDDSEIAVTIAKWYDDHAGAISITNDAGSVASDMEKVVQQLVMEMDLNISYELVTENYLKDSVSLNYLFNEYLPKGFGVFGHGHTHINHDALSHDDALKSFKKCFVVMTELGLKPVSYAYPGGFGYKLRTRRALKEAGFLSGRRFEKLDYNFPYIMPDDFSEPVDWYSLPSLVMQAYDYKNCSICTNNTEELVVYLDNTIHKKAWLILTYHSIGNNQNYGYYHLNDFKSDLIAIKSRDFWISSMDEITLYTYARNATKVKVVNLNSNNDFSKGLSIKIENSLNNSLFDVPLTLLIDLPYERANNVKLYKNSQKVNTKTSNDSRLKISIKPDEEIILTH